jgi:hypothetical protein
MVVSAVFYFAGKRMTAARILFSLGKPNTLPVAIGASRTIATAAGSSLRHIPWRSPSF